MNRRQIYLTDYEIREMKRHSSDLDISISEYIRRVIDEHLDKKKLEEASESSNNKKKK